MTKHNELTKTEELLHQLEVSDERERFTNMYELLKQKDWMTEELLSLYDHASTSEIKYKILFQWMRYDGTLIIKNK